MSSARVRVADVALDPRSSGSDALYTYAAEDDLQVGQAVFVPLGKRAALGFVTRIYESSEQELGFALRPISAKVQGLSLPPPIIDVARFVADQYLCPLPVALSGAILPGLRDRLITSWIVTGTDSDLTTLQQEVLRFIGEGGGELMEGKSKKLQPSFSRALRALRAKGVVEQVLKLVPTQERRKADILLRLTPDASRIEDFLKGEGKKKPSQALTVMVLQEAEQAYFLPQEIKAMAGVTDATLKALQDAGMLEVQDEANRTVTALPTPNPAQQIAIDALSSSVKRREFKPFLLFGVTGSGKTEVYLRAAAEALKQGRQVLYLVPEIALAAQAIAQLRERFGKSVTILHSDLTPTERLQNWLKIRQGQVSVVLGARSALFAPLDNIGLIVVDEEHEASYKQESAPRYHAKSVAMFLAEQHKCPLVLGSATPSVESFFEAEEGEFKDGLTLLTLPLRTADAQLPSVLIRDLTEGYRSGKPSILSPDLHDRIWMTLERKQQTILFLNRRAYAPFVICRDCGHQFTCPNCSVSLSYHRRDRKLRCHHCGYRTTPPDACPKCKGVRLNPFGVGTEKVEEAVSEEFPQARVARLDRDIARRKGALEETLAAFRSGDIDILVGTQIVAKGLDFPNVTLVGVIAADVSLNIPDFRSSERTFQLLSQVSGRAGRGRAPGQVVIQTFNPNHIAVQAAQTHDYLPFYEATRMEREVAGYPPFKRLVNVLLSGPSRPQVLQASHEAADRLKAVVDGELLGPADCPMERIQTKWRRHLLVKLPPHASVAPVEHALSGFEPKMVQVVLDVDPYSLM